MLPRIKLAGSSCPTSYNEILRSGLRPGTDFIVLDGGLNALASCMLAAPHGGKIEPFTSELVKAVADLGPWAWYSFEGLLRSRNWQRLHITSTSYDEPRLLALLPKTEFVFAVHGMDGAGRCVVVGGGFSAGRAVVAQRLRVALNPSRALVIETDGTGSRGGLAGLSPNNLVNRGARAEGIQIEISRGLRNLLREDIQAFSSACARIHASLLELTRT